MIPLRPTYDTRWSCYPSPSARHTWNSPWDTVAPYLLIIMSRLACSRCRNSHTRNFLGFLGLRLIIDSIIQLSNLGTISRAEEFPWNVLSSAETVGDQIALTIRENAQSLVYPHFSIAIFFRFSAIGQTIFPFRMLYRSILATIMWKTV